MAKSQTQAAQMQFAETAAREKIQQLLSLFPGLQAEFMNGTGAVTQDEAARLKNRDYHREYYRRKRKKKTSTQVQSPQVQGPRFSAAGRKKLSEAMKRRWAAARAEGHPSLMEKGKQEKKKGSKVINAAEAIQAQLKVETARDRKNRLQREWRAARKGKK